MTTRVIDTWQGLTAIVGVTLGLVPLATMVIGAGDPGLWRLVLDDTTGGSRWLGPLLVVVAAAAVIAGLERWKRDCKG